MSASDNVIQISDYFKNNSSKESPDTKASACEVESISKIREDMISEERRKVKRTLLTEFVGASLVVPGSGLVKVALNDISAAGLSFDVLKKYGQLKKGEPVAVRVYLNHTTYFPLHVTVTNSRFLLGENVYRHGAKFMEGTVNQEAIQHFISFMESVSTSLRADKGDVLLTK